MISENRLPQLHVISLFSNAHSSHIVTSYAREHIMSQQDLYTFIPDYVFEIWQGIVNSISSLLHVPCVMISRLEQPDLAVIRSSNNPNNPFPSETKIPLLGDYFATALQQQENLSTDTIENTSDTAESLLAHAGIIAYQALPLRWPGGEIFGIIMAIDTKERIWDSTSRNLMFTFRAAIEAHLTITDVMVDLHKKNRELEKALTEVKQLQGLLPVCAYCRKIRDDNGYWEQIERYISRHTELKFSHSICPECYEKLMKDHDI